MCHVLGGTARHPADVATHHVAEELKQAVNRARADDTPEAIKRHRNITPRVELIASALDRTAVMDSLWPDQLAIELLGGWSAVFTPAATKGLAKGAAAAQEATCSSEDEEEDAAKQCGESPPASKRPWLAERFVRLWYLMRL